MKEKKRSKEQQRFIDYLDKAIAEYTAKHGNDYDELYELIAYPRPMRCLHGLSVPCFF